MKQGYPLPDINLVFLNHGVLLLLSLLSSSSSWTILLLFSSLKKIHFSENNVEGENWYILCIGFMKIYSCKEIEIGFAILKLAMIT